MIERSCVQILYSFSRILWTTSFAPPMHACSHVIPIIPWPITSTPFAFGMESSGGTAVHVEEMRNNGGPTVKSSDGNLIVMQKALGFAASDGIPKMLRGTNFSLPLRDPRLGFFLSKKRFVDLGVTKAQSMLRLHEGLIKRMYWAKSKYQFNFSRDVAILITPEDSQKLVSEGFSPDLPFVTVTVDMADGYDLNN